MHQLLKMAPGSLIEKNIFDFFKFEKDGLLIETRHGQEQARTPIHRNGKEGIWIMAKTIQFFGTLKNQDKALLIMPKLLCTTCKQKTFFPCLPDHSCLGNPEMLCRAQRPGYPVA